jgi:tetratricopeptide (TPR) repeat protein
MLLTRVGVRFLSFLYLSYIKGHTPTAKELAENRIFPALEGPNRMDLGRYCREQVSNVDSIQTLTHNDGPCDGAINHETSHYYDSNNLGRAYFDLGLRLMFSYQHERAVHSFLACLSLAPHCALAHGFIALCHSPNYNFKGEAYYESTHHPNDEHVVDDLLCIFPSQQVADRHSKLAVEKVEELRKRQRKQNSASTNNNNNKKGGKKGGKKHSQVTPSSSSAVTTTDESDKNNTIDSIGVISDVETQLLQAIRILCCQPGIDSGLSEEAVGRPYANALRKLQAKYPQDAEVCYLLGEALMVLNAWKLFEYPTGRPLSPDVLETQSVLESALQLHPRHPGLCHMYVHLMEMSSHPAKALAYCPTLRNDFPHAGHLIHMPTHIDVLVGDYVSCVRSNCAAVVADERSMQISPETAGHASFYFGYIVHNYHMAVYGAILAGMEHKAMELAQRLNQHLNETMFTENPDLVDYLESYSALELHVMVRFGRWQDILQVTPPKDSKLMLFRAATLKYARALAYAMTNQILEAKREADRFDALRQHDDAKYRILHNNSVYDLLAVDAPMLRGEMAYRQGKYEEAFKLLRKAVQMQDALNYDEPWGKMQPIRHALGGLLLEQGHGEEAEQVFRTDLVLHPKNPWAVIGLIRCLERKLETPTSDCCCEAKNEGAKSNSQNGTRSEDTVLTELQELRTQFEIQQQTEWVDFKVEVACLCCQVPQ